MEKLFSTAKAKLLRQVQDKEVHIRNLEAFIAQRDAEIETLRSGLSDPALLEASRRRTTDFWQPPPRPSPDAFGQSPGSGAVIQPGFRPSLREFVFKLIVGSYWMQIGVLRQYEPRPIHPENFPPPRVGPARLPRLAIVTPSFNQALFIEATLRSVLDQDYPRLRYAVHDGGSSDSSLEIIARHEARLAFWESANDRGQSDAIGKGFDRLTPGLGADDVMAWLNSDDLAMPGALRYVAEYFATHPEVDAIYGHRIIIDDASREIGRWIMPRHDPRALEWIDYVPQETLFWRKRAWDRVGGLDPDFQFALDWDLLARFTQLGMRVVRLPYFLGYFRVHDAQKTARHIHSTGAEEMKRVRERFHAAGKANDMLKIEAWARRVRFCGVVTARLMGLGIRI